MAATSDIYLIRKNQQWVKWSAVVAVSLTGMASDDLTVWSGEYRDIFTPKAAGNSIPYATSASTSVLTATNTEMYFPDDSVVALNATGGGVQAVVLGDDAKVANSDDHAHNALRQTSLKRTHWKFDRGVAANPRYLYATWADGDMVADNPPETA